MIWNFVKGHATTIGLIVLTGVVLIVASALGRDTAARAAEWISGLWSKHDETAARHEEAQAAQTDTQREALVNASVALEQRRAEIRGELVDMSAYEVDERERVENMDSRAMAAEFDRIARERAKEGQP